MYHLSLLWCNHFLLLFVWLIASFTPSPFVASSVLVLFLSTGGSWDQIWHSDDLQGLQKGNFEPKRALLGAQVGPYLIFVTNITNGMCGENLSCAEISDFYT